jgi:hypothetical protein
VTYVKSFFGKAITTTAADPTSFRISVIVAVNTCRNRCYMYILVYNSVYSS